MAHLALALLGPFQATLDGQPAEGLNSDHRRALLAYLAVESRREHPRDQVASLLWPERSDQEALSALRYTLSNLRDALGDRRSTGDRQATSDRPAPSPFLLVTRTHVQFNPASDHWLDITEYQDLSKRSDVHSLEQAVALYRGHFLNGLSIGDSPAFEEWILLKGEEIQRSLLTLLNRLTALQMSRGETGEAAHWARRQLELEPYREQAHRQLMTALALGGDRSAALEHFETCRRLLAQELGCEPEDETRELYTQIQTGSLPQPKPIPTILSEPTWQASPGPGAEPTFRFVARQEELAKLGSLLDQAMAGRGGVALVAGEAGGGKTVLLDEFARQAGQAHSDLIALRGRCNAHGSGGDLFLPFREILQTLAGDVESKRAGGTLSPEQARRAWEALPVMGAALVEHGPDLIDSFVPGEALLRRLEGFSTSASTARWEKQLRETIARAIEGAPALQPDLFSQVTQVLHTLSLRSPLLLEIDDLQWADSGTAALLFHLGRRLAGSRILLVCAYRPQELSSGQGSQTAEPGAASGAAQGSGSAADVGAVLRELAREWGDVLVDLERADGQAFVEAYVDSEPNCLVAAFRQTLYEHTGGNPLFTVELLRSFERQAMLVRDEAGRWIEAPGLDWAHCPPQVEAVIAGHLADLPDEDQALLQTAAVQGEQFIAEIVARVLSRDEEAIIRRLSGPLRTRHRLIDAVSLDRLASTGQRLSYYRFRHALLQRSAYGSLDTVRCTRLHEATGQALEAIYAAEGERPQSLAPMLARHFEAAGLRVAAAHAFHDAGRQAGRLSAYRDALNLFDHGLALLAKEPPSTERREIERLLDVARLAPLRNLSGSGGVELAGALKQAIEAGAGEAPGWQGLMMLQAEGDSLSAKGKFGEALAVAEQMSAQAAKWDDEAFLVLSHWRFGFIYHLMGQPQEAKVHFDWILAWLTPKRWADLRAAVGIDLTANTLSFSALNQWFMGYPEQALRFSAQAVTGAIERGDKYGLALAYALGSITLFLLRNDEAALQERSELCCRLSKEQGFAWWQAYAEVFLGWLAVMGGEDAGIERMQNAIAGWRQTSGMTIGTDGLVVVLADGCLTAARRRLPGDDAVRASLLATGLAAIDALLGPEVPCEQSFEAELHRLKGELLLEKDGLAAVDETLVCFGQSMQLGREMGALAWELRAAMSLVRLRKRQGKAAVAELAEARMLLSNQYERFMEGFTFPDLQEAAALIDEAG